MSWVKQVDDKSLPVWLTSNLKSKCECGWDMENFYNPQGSITARKCSNPKCPYMMAEKVVGVAELLGIKGIGSKTAFNIVSSNGLQSHFEAIPFITREKPVVTLYTFLRMAFIKGVDTGWNAIAGDYSNIDELLEKYHGEYEYLLNKHKAELLIGKQFVTFKTVEGYEFEPVVTGTVMISGNIRGLSNRNDFIWGLNQASKGLIRIGVSESKRKTGVMALIQEADTPNRGKAECAIENHIPIMTPKEFVAYVSKLANERVAAKN